MKQLIPLFLLTLATNSIAAINQFGDLSWDTSTDYIVNSRYNRTYVQFGLVKDFTTQEVINLTSPGGLYEDFHIANSTEAFEYINAALELNLANSPSVWDVYSGDITNGNYVDGMFGAAHSSLTDYIFYLGDFPNQVGGMTFRGDTGQNWRINDYFIDPDVKDYFSGSGIWNFNASPWLLVNNTQVTSVPEPQSAFMLTVGLGLLSLASLNKKNKAKNL